ncbi:MAG: M20 family metallopeptidase [Tatlockia sp.]|jgi:acetylornithine deacetylase/succinyl-diaminopimelate desuccinylase-like protein
MLNPQKLLDFIRHQWKASIIPSLSDYIKIPNKSPHFDENWQANGHMEKAVTHMADWCLTNGPDDMQLEILRLPGRTPLLLLDIAGDLNKTVLLYGHLDKQPEMDGWAKGYGPWTPVLKNNCLYGRGAADDGYAVYAAMTAIKALKAQKLPHARCVVLIEACEESGSYDLPFYIEALKEKIGAPGLIICLDSGAGNYDQLWMTTSLRGNLVGELSVELLKEGVHSGNASGIVADSFRIARTLLSRIEDEQTGDVRLSELFCDIPAERVMQAAQCAAVLGEKVYKGFPLIKGVVPLNQDNQQLVLNRTWRPALTVTGAEGLPALQDAGNVLRPKTVLKLSMRIPPRVCKKKAAAALERVLTENPPYKAMVSFKIQDAAQGWDAPPLAKWLAQAVEDASTLFYQNKAMYMGEGGTIPFMAMLGEKFPEAQFMITGVLGPHSNAHGPNEFLQLEMAEKLTACVSYVLHQHFVNETVYK